jgi:hypothetical protein
LLSLVKHTHTHTHTHRVRVVILSKTHTHTHRVRVVIPSKTHTHTHRVRVLLSAPSPNSGGDLESPSHSMCVYACMEGGQGFFPTAPAPDT